MSVTLFVEDADSDMECEVEDVESLDMETEEVVKLVGVGDAVESVVELIIVELIIVELVVEPVMVEPARGELARAEAREEVVGEPARVEARVKAREPVGLIISVEPKQSLVVVIVVVKTTLVVPGCTLLPERNDGSDDKPDNANVNRPID